MMILIVSDDLLDDQMNKHTFRRQLQVNRRKPLSGLEDEWSLLKKVDRQLGKETIDVLTGLRNQ